MKALGIALFYLAAIYAVMATSMGTCTMGSADGLLIGPMFCIPVYTLGFALWTFQPVRKTDWLFMIPAILLIAYQCGWSAAFSIAYLVYATPACDFFTGNVGFDFDGRELEFVALWLGMSTLSLGGIAWAWMRTRRYAPINPR